MIKLTTIPRRLSALLIIAALALAVTAPALAGAKANHRGPLSGNWTGFIGSGGSRQRIAITINARETGGSWKLGAGCYGPLTLDSISDGYHHYRRHVASGAICTGGDVDCLKRAGAGLYDAVTSHLGGSWDTSGTLKRA
jgi:hypothetical protein